MFDRDDVLQSLADLPPEEAGLFTQAADFAARLPAGAGSIIGQAARAVGWTFRQALDWLMQHPGAVATLATDLLAQNWSKALTDLLGLFQTEPAPAR